MLNISEKMLCSLYFRFNQIHSYFHKTFKIHINWIYWISLLLPLPFFDAEPKQEPFFFSLVGRSLDSFSISTKIDSTACSTVSQIYSTNNSNNIIVVIFVVSMTKTKSQDHSKFERITTLMPLLFSFNFQCFLAVSFLFFMHLIHVVHCW